MLMSFPTTSQGFYSGEETQVMKLKELQDAMIAAMKAKDKFRKDAIADLVSAVKKKGIDAGCRENIPDDMAIEAILKEIKTVKEQIDTCPADRTELLADYKKKYEIMVNSRLRCFLQTKLPQFSTRSSPMCSQPETRDRL